MNVSVICDYCGAEALVVTGKQVYPGRPDLWDKLFYKCHPCDAWVGCHPGTERPLGRLANAELRSARCDAHTAFDPIWKDRFKRRGDAYAWLAEQLGVAKQDCHIGMFDVDMCRRVVEISIATDKPKAHTLSGAYVAESVNDGVGSTSRESFDAAVCFQCGERFAIDPGTAEQTCPLCETTAPVSQIHRH